MRVVIMGCGRVGEQVCMLMADAGHDVAVIDQNPEALERLGARFKGQRVRGVGFDREVLVEAGIEQADAFAATSSSDTANIIAARIARNVFFVPRVVARLYDPHKAEIYRRLGLMTISSTTWGAERIRELLMHSDFDPLISFGNGEVQLLTIETPPSLIGRQVKNLTISSEIIVAGITRHGQAFIPLLGTELRSGDQLHLIVHASSMDRLQDMLGLGEGG